MTKKKKIIIALLSILGALILLCVILFFTAFSLKSVDIEFETTNTKFNEQTLTDEIMSSCDIDFKKSVFLVDKQKTITSIEQEFPYLKVVNLEIKFPNSITIHLAQRQEIFVFEKNSKYYVVDESLKVLEICDTYTSTKQNAILVEGVEIVQDNADIKLSTILELNGFTYQDFANITLSLYKNNRTKIESMAYFKSIKFQNRTNPATYEEEKTLILYSHSGFEYNIYDFENRLEMKFNKLFASEYSTESVNRSEYMLIVYENSSGEIYAKLKSLI